MHSPTKQRKKDEVEGADSESAADLAASLNRAGDRELLATVGGLSGKAEIRQAMFRDETRRSGSSWKSETNFLKHESSGWEHGHMSKEPNGSVRYSKEQLLELFSPSLPMPGFLTGHAIVSSKTCLAPVAFSPLTDKERVGTGSLIGRPCDLLGVQDTSHGINSATSLQTRQTRQARTPKSSAKGSIRCIYGLFQVSNSRSFGIVGRGNSRTGGTSREESVISPTHSEGALNLLVAYFRLINS